MKDAAQSILNADRQKPAAQQKYADITTIADDNYFSIVSAERLGTVQTHQFQSSYYKMQDGTIVDQQGTNWHWGTKCTAEGTCDSSAAPASTNSILTEMPREYYQANDSFGAYFNWYGATAESGIYTPAGAHAKDSICPSGWHLPIGSANLTLVSWHKLAVGTYQLGSNRSAALFVTSSPFEMVFAGNYSVTNGVVEFRDSNYHTRYFSATRASENTAYAFAHNVDHIYSTNSFQLLSGGSVRCVKY